VIDTHPIVFIISRQPVRTYRNELILPPRLEKLDTHHPHVGWIVECDPESVHVHLSTAPFQLAFLNEHAFARFRLEHNCSFVHENVSDFEVLERQRLRRLAAKRKTVVQLEVEGDILHAEPRLFAFDRAIRHLDAGGCRNSVIREFRGREFRKRAETKRPPEGIA